MLSELRETLAGEAGGSIDWITFVGSGEPTLNRDLGTMLRGVKDMTDIPVAVITNGSLLRSRELREELAAADAVLPTLDAGSSSLFRRINRPPAEFSFADHLDGLIAFGAGRRGKLWLEVMLIAGLNDGEAALRDIAAAVRRIGPDQVHLLLPTRPPAEDWVLPAGEAGLERAKVLLGEAAPVIVPDERRGEFGEGPETDPVEAALGIIARHPLSGEQLIRVLARRGARQPEEAIRLLANSGKVVEVMRYGKSFWRLP